MISLTYLSTATRPFAEAELTTLLTRAREKNRALGLTGMLLHADGHFIQTLEGEESAVQAVFDLIGTDRRHRSVDVALREEVAGRAFPDWSMGFRALAGDDMAALPGYTDFLTERAGSSAAPGRAGIFHRVFRDAMRHELSRS